jgi:hypothetical protein
MVREEAGRHAILQKEAEPVGKSAVQRAEGVFRPKTNAVRVLDAPGGKF